MRRPREDGSALLIALATLALLSAFAISLMALVKLEVAATRNDLDGRRATLAAEAGLNRAIVELSDTFDEPLSPCIPTWAYLDKQGDYGHGVPMPDAGRISLGSGTVTLEDTSIIPFSGCIGHTYSDGSDLYSLKVIDCTTQIDLNDERPGLAQMLDTLGLAIADQRGRDPVRGRGAEILAFRNRELHLSSKRELVTLLGPDDYKLLADFVTVDGWQDPAARRALTAKERNPAAEDMSLPRFMLERRCPVNVNAAPRAVLVALFTGVGTPSIDPISFDQARRIADLIVQRRKSLDPTEGPFRGLVDFGSWLGALASSGSQAILSQDQSNALVANLDPNVRVVEVNPDATARLGVNKYDLDYRTTEVAFFSHGKFEVTSLGRITAAGKIVAESYRLAVIRAYEIARQTTQLDFEMSSLAATTPNSASFPNQTRRLGGWAASNDDGYIQLDDPDAQVGLDLTAMRLFQTAFTSTLDGDEQNMSGGTYLGQMLPGYYDLRTGVPTYMTGTVVRPSSVTGGSYPALGERAEDKLVLMGGDLNVDGTHTSQRHHLLYYGVAPPASEGTIDLWLKSDQDTTAGAGSILQAVNVLTNDVIMVTELTGATDGKTLTLELRKKVYFASATAVVPYSTGESRTRAVLKQLGTYGEFHHVRIAWVNGTEAQLYVDGDLQPAAVKLPLDPKNPPWPPACALPASDSITIGGHDSPDGPLWRQMTIDDVVVEGAPVSLPSSFPAPERYPAENVDYVGRFVGAFGPYTEDCQFGTIYWTERDPTGWGKVQFSLGDFTTTAVVNNTIPINGDHSGKKGPGGDGPGGDDHGDHGDGGDNGQGNGGGKGKKGPGGGGTRMSGGANTAPAPQPQDYLRPELSVFRPATSPSDRAVIYEIRFRYQKDNLVARGILVPPLNVSPILDDVTLVYRTRAMIIRTETDDD